ncbi:hypothetical protein BDW42DRAFT_160949 [Aspergillus taichungensis]|uniref:Secreted protein n=1 Tax=Aspergillus taichungensis TaxID=482145 RepID=A0A2J5I689_9EURO|nr:hypothetical protein BDW42DRAFT_160949 [Aspergillus taichungensis]
MLMRWASWQRHWLFPHRARVPVCWCLFGHVLDNKGLHGQLFPASHHFRHLPPPRGDWNSARDTQELFRFSSTVLYSLVGRAISGFFLDGCTFKMVKPKGC